MEFLILVALLSSAVKFSKKTSIKSIYIFRTIEEISANHQNLITAY